LSVEISSVHLVFLCENAILNSGLSQFDPDESRLVILKYGHVSSYMVV